MTITKQIEEFLKSRMLERVICLHIPQMTKRDVDRHPVHRRAQVIEFMDMDQDFQVPAHISDTLGEFLHGTGNRARHDHVVFAMSNGATITYNDTRRFGFMTLARADELASHKLISGLGVEPLGGELTPEYLAMHCKSKKTSLKAALLDQRLIAGLGNIYVCEALYRSGLSPRRSASALATRSAQATVRAKRLVPEIRAVLEDAIEAGGSTLRDYHAPEGDLGYFQHSFAVYGREGLECARPSCGGTIRRIVQGGRSTFYCPRCQR